MSGKHETPTILTNPEVLSEEHLPSRMRHNQETVAEIEECLAPISRNQRPLHVWLYGPPGAGKTATARHVLEEARRESGLRGLHVNCWQHDSLYSVLDHLTTELRILRAEEQRSTRKLEKFRKHLGDRPFLLILDEIDRPAPAERSRLLYSFCSLKTVGLIAISNSNSALFELDARVRSRLNPALLVFEPYTEKKLTEILVERAQLAFARGSWTRKLLRQTARLAAGDARAALKTLRRAAWIAERARAKRITPRHMQKAWNSMRRFRARYLLSKLTQDHRIIHRIVQYQKEILSRDLRQLYLVECSRAKRKPVAERTFSNYINDLKNAGLAKVERARVKGKVRLVKTVQ